MPDLCPHHRAVVANLAQRDHIGDADSERVAAEMARQCCNTHTEPRSATA